MEHKTARKPEKRAKASVAGASISPTATKWLRHSPGENSRARCRHSPPPAGVPEGNTFLQKCRESCIPVLNNDWVDALLSSAAASLGAGAYGSCVKVADPRGGTELVIKTFSGRATENLAEEALKLHNLQLPGVQRLVGVCADSRRLVTQYAGDTLLQYFGAPTHFSDFRRDFLRVFLRVARTVRAMHQVRWCHNDLKHDNVCVAGGRQGPVATIIDVGLAQPVGTRHVYGPAAQGKRFPWVAPEVLARRHPCSEASDVYGLALMAATVLAQRGAAHEPSMLSLQDWLMPARSSDPARRPSLNALIACLKTLQAWPASAPVLLPPAAPLVTHQPGWPLPVLWPHAVPGVARQPRQATAAPRHHAGQANTDAHTRDTTESRVL